MASVIAAGIVVLYFFPIFPSDRKEDGGVEFRTYGVIGLAIASRFVAGHFGNSGVQGLLMSLWGTIELIFYGGAIGIVVHGSITALAAADPQRAGFGVFVALA